MAQIYVPQPYTQSVPYNQVGILQNYNPATDQQQQQPSSGFSMPSFGNLFGGNSNTGIFSGIRQGATNAINSFGANFGLGTSYTAPIGPSLGGAPLASSYSPTALSGTTGSALLGGVGIGATIGGLIGGGKATSSIGGGIGGGIGMVAGGPIGAAIGGALGGIAGGLFGGKPKAKVSIFSNSIDDQGNMGKAYVGNKTLGAEQANETFNTVQPYLQGLSKMLGPLKPVNIVGGTHSKWGGNFIAAIPGDKATESEDVPKEYINNFTDGASFNSAMDNTLRSVARYSGYSDDQINTALANLQQSAALGANVNRKPLMITPPKEGNFKQFLQDYKVKTNAPAKPAAIQS